VIGDLGEDDLLAHPERVVAPPVEAARREAAEVADARQRDRDEPVEEVVHAGAPKRDLRPNRHPGTDLEAGDRLLGAAHLRTLACDDRELLDGTVQRAGVRLRLTDAHVERDLLDPRDPHHGAVRELLLEAPADLLVVEAPQARDVGVRLRLLGLRRRRHGLPVELLEAVGAPADTDLARPRLALLLAILVPDTGGPVARRADE